MAVRTSSVEVAIRVRPLRPELSEVKTAWEIHKNMLAELNSENDTTFTFDRVYDVNSETEEVYDKSVRDSIVRNVVQGYNGTVFAYGQTGSGKSHTMLGDKAGKGISSMALHDLFAGLQAEKARGKTIKVLLEMLEIYNEQLVDLMAKTSSASVAAALSIRENEHGVYVHNAMRKEVTSAQNCLDSMDIVAANRTVAATKMNEQSSRSHCLIRIIVEKSESFDADSTDSDEEASPTSASSMQGKKKLQKKVVSSMNLVDLAGSERVAKTGATGIRMVEGGHINKSLTCLTTVIHKLSEPQPKKGGAAFIPFRDSKLTHLLKTALGGNSFTTVFCCITPAQQHVDESRSTLYFAQRAKAIKNQITMNEVMDTKTKIRDLEAQVKRLRRLLVASDIYVYAKELMARRAAEQASSGALAEQATAANEHVARLESLVQQLTQENETIKQEAQEAAQFLGRPGGAAAAAGMVFGGHVDPAFGFADSEEVSALKVRVQELETELADAGEDRKMLSGNLAELEDICEGLTQEAQDREAAMSELKAKIRQQEAEFRSIEAELASRVQQHEQTQALLRQQEEAMLHRARGDALLEQLTQQQIAHQELELEHSTLMEMFSKAEIEAAAKEESLKEEGKELARRVELLKTEAQDHNAFLWRVVSLAHLASQGSAMSPEDVRVHQTVKPVRAEQALKALELFVASRSNRPPQMNGGGDATPSRQHTSHDIGGPAPAAAANTPAAPSSGNEEALTARIKELEGQLQLNESRRDIIIDTKLKRMQDLVLRLHTTNTRLSEDVRKVCEENNALHDIIRRESKTAKAARKDGLEPVNEQLLRTRALLTAVPEPPHWHN